MGGTNSKVQPQKKEVITIEQSEVLKSYKKWLVEWSSMSKGEIIYDSNTDSKLAKEFYSITFNKPNLYFITIDEMGNSFGAYFAKPVDKMDSWIYDEKNFIFVLNSNNRFSEPIKWNAKVGEQGGIRFYDKDINKLFEVGNGEFWGGMRFGYYSIADINVKNSFFYNISFRYDGINNTDLNGRNGPNNPFSVDRIIVLQMLN
ncbi:hypothetical protein CL6EHI_125330 [Entamoeba histolytica]|uniref:TLDc domain-containing protein n=1 Tax=Entamoeba histolytica TaxID=5759 RepID=A0A175JTV1_ENTHI|nr:hypothetical protein CL6EHI_125330 [Entamoeba histolytica]